MLILGIKSDFTFENLKKSHDKETYAGTMNSQNLENFFTNSLLW